MSATKTGGMFLTTLSFKRLGKRNKRDDSSEVVFAATLIGRDNVLVLQTALSTERIE